MVRDHFTYRDFARQTIPRAQGYANIALSNYRDDSLIPVYNREHATVAVPENLDRRAQVDACSAACGSRRHYVPYIHCQSPLDSDTTVSGPASCIDSPRNQCTIEAR